MNPRASTSIAALYEPHYGLQLLLLLAFLIPAILFLLTQQNTLRRVRPQNRKMIPGLVWLQLIPFLGQLWQFFVIVKIAGSIKNELIYRHEDALFGSDAAKVELGNKRPTLAIGLVYSIVMWLCYLLTIYQNLAAISYSANQTVDMTRTAADIDRGSVAVGLLAFATIGCWIVYWIVLAVWKRRLKNEVRPAL